MTADHKPDELRAHLKGAGFDITQWQDVSAEGIAWVKRLGAAVQARDAGAPSPPSVLGLIFGKGWHLLAADLARNLIERRIIVAEAVARKPA